MNAAFSSAVATARSLEEPGTNPRPPQPPAAEGQQQYAMLPAGLKQFPFCCWRYERRENSNKPAKVPYNPRTGARANTADPSTFVSFEAAERAYGAGAYNGIGVLIAGNLAAIDIDHCIDDNGQLSPIADDIVKRMESYTEISPSGRGLRILFRVPPDFHFDSRRYYINNQKLRVEIYVAGATVKYVTVTGRVLTSDVSLEVRGPELGAVLEKYMLRPQPQVPALAPAAPLAPTGVQLMVNDCRLIEDIRKSPSGERFMSLGCGDMLTCNNDHSSADLGFCNIIAAHTDDPEQIDRIFRASKLMRPKWDEPRGDSTYGWITIHKAIAGAQSYREQNRMEQMQQVAAQSAPLVTTPAAIDTAEPVPNQEAGQEPAQSLDLAAVQAAVCVQAEVALQPQGQQVLNAEQILAQQKQQRQQEMLAKYPAFSAQDLYNANLPPVCFLVSQLLSEGVGILVAASKFGKSFMALCLALCLAWGEPFLDHETTQCGVLYLALEDNWQRLQGRMKRMLQGRCPPAGFYIMIQSPNMEGGLFELIDAQLAAHPEIKLVIIDTLQKVRGGPKSKEGAYGADYRELGAWKDFYASRNVSVLLVHHTNKRQDETDLYNKISGTNGIMGAVDTIWVAEKEKRGEAKGSLNITGRDVEDTELIIQFNKQTLTWELVGSKDEMAEEEKRKEYKSSPVVQAIKALVNGNQTGTWHGSSADIIKHMGASGKVLSSQEVAKEILKYQDLLLEYDCIYYRLTNTKSTGGRRHCFYVQDDAEDSESVEDPSSNDPEESVDTSTDTQPAE